jgi:hypothetical protein
VLADPKNPDKWTDKLKNGLDFVAGVINPFSSKKK